MKAIQACLPLGGVILVLAALSSAFAQSAPDFTLQASAFSPIAVAPGGTSASNILLNPLNGFNSAVALACTVTPATAITPVCLMSPTSVTPPAGGAATITAATNAGGATPGLYTISFTGTATVNGTQITHTAQQSLTVLAVTPQFTITVIGAVAPSSVHAGSGGSGVLQVTPINGYSGTVTLSCSSVTPPVTVPPVCSFSPQPLKVSGVPVISQISINTTGPTTILPQIRAQNHPGVSPWLALMFPMLAVVGLSSAGRAGKRSRQIWQVFLMLILASCFLLTPACGNNIPLINNRPTQITPKDSYVFTLAGVDANGNTSSNAGASTSPTVSLTVD